MRKARVHTAHNSHVHTQPNKTILSSTLSTRPLTPATSTRTTHTTSHQCVLLSSLNTPVQSLSAPPHVTHTKHTAKTHGTRPVRHRMLITTAMPVVGHTRLGRTDHPSKPPSHIHPKPTSRGGYRRTHRKEPTGKRVAARSAHKAGHDHCTWIQARMVGLASCSVLPVSSE